jgi:RHS repeat-associated protein
MAMPGRTYSAGTTYRYGFNGQEKSDEIAAGLTTALYWEYDSRTGRRWNVDPVVKENESPYLCFNGNPVRLTDQLGDSPKDWVGIKNGDGTITPEFRKDVTSKTKLADGEIYIGKQKVIGATDQKYYHLKINGKASEISKEKFDKLKIEIGEATLSGGSKPEPKKKEEKPKNEEPGNDKENNEGKKGQGIPFILGFGQNSPDFFSGSYSGPISVFGKFEKIKNGGSVEPLSSFLNISVNYVNDRYGNVYISPLNLGIGTPGNSANIMIHNMFKPTVVTRKELYSYLTGVSYGVSGGFRFLGGAVSTNQNGSMISVGFGLTSGSGFGASIGFQPEYFSKGGGKKWGDQDK